MKYLYYFPDTFLIHTVSDRMEVGLPMPWIELNQEDQRLFLANPSVADYRVDVVPETRRGRLVPVRTKEQDKYQQKRINYQYAIPLNAGNDVDFVVTQHTETKQLEIVIAEHCRELWLSNNTQEWDTVYLVACWPNDPHFPLWTFNIERAHVKEKSLVYNYQGSDCFRLYTKNVFGSYSHVVI